MNILRQVNWFAVTAIIMIVAMFVAVLSPDVPAFFAVPLGITAITSAILGLYEKFDA